jgi:hypothetical protein
MVGRALLERRICARRRPRARPVTVYVDQARNPLGRMRCCHMVADELDELHAMAAAIGMRRAWFQAEASTPHYDVSLSRRRLAIEHGAVEIDRRAMAIFCRRWRARAGGLVVAEDSFFRLTA